MIQNLSKADKESLFNLLKTADSYFYGYTRNKFAKIPDFPENIAAERSDSISISDSNQNETSLSAISTTSTNNSTNKPSGLTLTDLNAKILRCTRCGLARTRNNVVPGQGVEHPDVLVIGEGPGYDEDMQGLPFVGKAGVLLDKMLAAIQLSRNTNCYIANIVKCRPPENRDPFPDEQSACISFLEAQIHILKPKMILCMGRISGHKMLKSELPMNQLHGQIFDYNGIPLMVTYHPSALLRNESLKSPAWNDLKIFRRKLDEIKSFQ